MKGKSYKKLSLEGVCHQSRHHRYSINKEHKKLLFILPTAYVQTKALMAQRKFILLKALRQIYSISPQLISASLLPVIIFSPRPASTPNNNEPEQKLRCGAIQERSEWKLIWLLPTNGHNCASRTNSSTAVILKCWKSTERRDRRALKEDVGRKSEKKLEVGFLQRQA